MPKLQNFRFPEGLLNCENTELKSSSKINVPVSEWHRWAVVGQDKTFFIQDEGYARSYIKTNLEERKKKRKKTNLKLV